MSHVPSLVWYTKGMDPHDRMVEPFNVGHFWGECPDCLYRFPTRIPLNGTMIAFRCPNCTGTDVQLELDDPMPAEVFEVWRPGQLTTEEKADLVKLRKRIEGQLEW